MVLGRKALPSINDKKIEGVALIEITKVEYKNNSFLRVEAKASTLIEQQKDIVVNIFDKSFTLSKEGFLRICGLGVDEYEDAIGQLLYVELAINNKEYQEISKIFLKVEEDILLHDPRISKQKNISLEELF
jgi:hypothetical protein